MEEKKQRGRIKGQVAKYSTIEDPIIAPYIVYVEEYGFSLEHKVEEKITSEGYYTSFSALLRALTHKKIVEKNKVMTLREYINEYKSILEQLKQIFNEN